MKKQLIFTIFIALISTALGIYLLTQGMIYSGVSALVLTCLIIVYRILRIREKKKQIILEEKQDEKTK